MRGVDPDVEVLQWLGTDPYGIRVEWFWVQLPGGPCRSWEWFLCLGTGLEDDLSLMTWWGGWWNETPVGSPTGWRLFEPDWWVWDASFRKGPIVGRFQRGFTSYEWPE